MILLELLLLAVFSASWTRGAQALRICDARGNRPGSVVVHGISPTSAAYSIYHPSPQGWSYSTVSLLPLNVVRMRMVGTAYAAIFSPYQGLLYPSRAGGGPVEMTHSVLEPYVDLIHFFPVTDKNAARPDHVLRISGNYRTSSDFLDHLNRSSLKHDHAMVIVRIAKDEFFPSQVGKDLVYEARRDHKITDRRTNLCPVLFAGTECPSIMNERVSQNWLSTATRTSQELLAAANNIHVTNGDHGQGRVFPKRQRLDCKPPWN